MSTAKLTAFAEATANLFAEFIKQAERDERVFGSFCNSFDSELNNPADRKRAITLLEKIKTEISSDKEEQKSGDNSTDRDSPTANQMSVFGAKAGSKTFVIDEMLATGRYTLIDIEKESGASLETVKRRLRTLGSKGLTITKNTTDGRVAVSK